MASHFRKMHPCIQICCVREADRTMARKMPVTDDTWNPTQYNRFQAERTQPFRDLLAMVAPQPDMHIVDLGCGTGELTAELHRTLHARRTIGIDRSKNMLSRAAAHAAGHAADGLNFEHGDLSFFETAG